MFRHSKEQFWCSKMVQNNEKLGQLLMNQYLDKSKFDFITHEQIRKFLIDPTDIILQQFYTSRHSTHIHSRQFQQYTLLSASDMSSRLMRTCNPQSKLIVPYVKESKSNIMYGYLSTHKKIRDFKAGNLEEIVLCFAQTKNGIQIINL